MIEPLDLLTAAQDMLIALIREQLPEEQRSWVRHTLEENAEPPFHLVAELTTEDAGGKDEQAERLTAEIHTVYRGSDRRELLGLMHSIKLATWRGNVVEDGVDFRFRWRSSGASAAASDGVTYAGVTLIDITAEPA